MDKNSQIISTEKSDVNLLLEYVFIEELKDLYWSEIIFSRVLKKLHNAAHSRVTRNILKKLAFSCDMHIKQLHKTFHSLNCRPQFQFFEDMCIFSEGSELAETIIQSRINGDNYLLAYAHKVCKYEKKSIDGLLEINGILKMSKLSQHLRNAGNSKFIFCKLLAETLTKRNNSPTVIELVKSGFRSFSYFLRFST